MVTCGRDLYSVLRCREGATQDELRQSYQRRLLRHHPDKNGGEESDEFLAVVEAWKVLGDPEERRRHDARAKLEEGEREANSQVWATVKRTEMEEEINGDRTFQCRCGGEFVLTEEDIEAAGDDDVEVGCDTCSLVIRVQAG